MDYSKIQADPVRGPEIGRMYLDASPFITTLARQAYRSFVGQVDQQFAQMTMDDGITVIPQSEDPYRSHSEMIEEVNRYHRLRIHATSGDQLHPLLSPEQNDRFRAVHDYYGHHGGWSATQSVPFDRHGEEAAWVRHSQMFTGLGRRAMTTETRGQSSALCWITSPDFPPEKAVLLPDWVSEIPAQYR